MAHCWQFAGLVVCNLSHGLGNHLRPGVLAPFFHGCEDPDLAVNVSLRMKEWETLIERTHKAGMKVIMDFVPTIDIVKPDIFVVNADGSSERS